MHQLALLLVVLLVHQLVVLLVVLLVVHQLALLSVDQLAVPLVHQLAVPLVHQLFAASVKLCDHLSSCVHQLYKEHRWRESHKPQSFGLGYRSSSGWFSSS